MHPLVARADGMWQALQHTTLGNLAEIATTTYASPPLRRAVPAVTFRVAVYRQPSWYDGRRPVVMGDDSEAMGNDTVEGLYYRR